jgi:hypothetical protein
VRTHDAGTEEITAVTMAVPYQAPRQPPPQPRSPLEGELALWQVRRERARAAAGWLAAAILAVILAITIAVAWHVIPSLLGIG